MTTCTIKTTEAINRPRDEQGSDDHDLIGSTVRKRFDPQTKKEPVDFSTGSFFVIFNEDRNILALTQTGFTTRDRSHGFGMRMVLIIALPLIAYRSVMG